MIYAALIGLTLLLVRGTIFRPIQKLSLFRCSQCTGWWVGVAAGASEIVPIGHGRILDACIVGCATSFLALLAEGILVKLLGDDPGEKENHA